ncbi:phage tail terminator protein [Rheinheimera gaetbuli]
MLDTALIEQRIRDQVQLLQSVEGAADYAAVKSLGSFRTPSAYVVLVEEQGNRDKTSRMVQQISAVFGVIIAVRNYRQGTGEDQLDDARNMVKAVRTALVGWGPASREFHACAWLQGDVLDYDDSTLLWCDVFETTYFVNGA